MLPANTQQYLLKNLKFCFENSYDYLEHKFIELNEIDLDWYKKTFDIKNNITFMEYYNIVGFPPLGRGEELFTLDQILENHQSQNWLNLFPDRVLLKEKYPEAGKRYLQITSIEGEGSYFYDIETDYVYDVNWGGEEAMIIGKLKPWFTSFYDFLEWYYSESDEE